MKSTTAEEADVDYYRSLRRDLHRHPELGLEEHRTAAIVAREVTRLGYRVETGIAGTGVVATLTRGSSGRSIGLRADMDALPITEETGLAHASTRPWLMHACGHDGHVATLLSAAQRIARSARFDGTVHLIFQPAEENAGGAALMIEDGLFERFPCDRVYGMHNDPLLPEGRVAWRHGPIMAAVDSAGITLKGCGGHEGLPHLARDPVVAAASLVLALQTIVSRRTDPRRPAVLNVAAIHGGSTSGIMPGEVHLEVGLRALDPATRLGMEEELKRLVMLHAESFGMEAVVNYRRHYGATINETGATDLLREALHALLPAERIVELADPFLFSEDFSYMLEQRPGSYFFIGGARAGENPGLHHPRYDFNDAIISTGTEVWTRLVETALRPA